jgi:tetratricopeptide (TPR) repeat protein
MRVKGVFIVAGAALAVSAPARAGQDILFGPPPDWVLPHAVELPDGGPADLPVRTLLLDNQVRMEKGRRSVYSDVALKFQTPDGLSAGNLSLPWQADTEDLTIHKLVIRRGDHTIDVLGSGQTFTVLRREQNLEQATLTGVLTANLFPEDLQVGDILELAMTVTSANPAFGEHSEAALGPLNGQIDRVYASLQWPAHATMRLGKSVGMPEWVRSRKNGFETAAIALEGVVPTPAPKSAPPRFGMIGFLEASDFSSWAELAAHFAPYYAEAALLPADGPLRAEVDRIRAVSNDPEAQAAAALQLVQSRVRYVALAMGEGGLIPANAALTWSRRFGDCKAKTALLLAILGELGIKAEPIFVNSFVGDALPDHLPLIAMFDHVLVRAHIGGREFWLDGTRTGDTSLDRLQVPYLRWGLPVLASGAELVSMVPPPLAEPEEDLAIHMDASKGVRDPVPTTIELTLRGDSALGMKQVLASLTGEAQDRALREYWRDRFRDIEPKAVGQAFDEATGEMRLTLDGLATMDWNGIWYETDETGVGYRADFSREPGPGDDAPYGVPYPVYERTRQTIILPEGLTSPLDSDAPVDETVAGLEYKRHATMEGNTFFVERTMRSIAPEFAAADAPDAQKRLRALYEKPVHLRMPALGDAAGKDAERTLGALPDDVDALVKEGRDFLDAGQYEDALLRFTRATELAPGKASVWADRGITLAWQGALDEALIDLNRAAALDPRDAVVFRGRGLVADQRQDFHAAIAAYDKAIEIEPSSAFAWGRRGLAHFRVDQTDEALADTAEAIRLSPNWVEMRSLRVVIFAGRQKFDEAADEIEALLASAPETAETLANAGGLYAMMGMRDKALELTERSLAINITPRALVQRASLREPADVTGRRSDFDQALELAPDFLPALALRANLRVDQGDPEGALADVNEALAATSSPSLELRQLRMYLARRLGRRDEALAEVAALMADQPDRVPVYIQASQTYAAFGMYAEAVDAVDKALGLSPEAYLYLNRSAARDPADYAGRLADIDEALRLTPNYGAAIEAKAQLLLDRGDYSAAARSFGQMLATQPNNPSLLNQRGIALAKLGRDREAERDFVQARKIVSAYPPEIVAQALNNLCYPKAVANVALRQALDECEEALRRQPDVAMVLDSRGTVLLRLGRLEEAIRDFDRALEQAPGIAPSRYLRAVAHSMRGDIASATADADAVRQTDPRTMRDLESKGFVLMGESATLAASPDTF